MDDAAFLTAFGVAATLAAASVTAIVDTASELELDGVITRAPLATVRAADAPAAAAGQAFVSGAVTYTVRQVLQVPPDGAFLRLVLTRV